MFQLKWKITMNLTRNVEKEKQRDVWYFKKSEILLYVIVKWLRLCDLTGSMNKTRKGRSISDMKYKETINHSPLLYRFADQIANKNLQTDSGINYLTFLNEKK